MGRHLLDMTGLRFGNMIVIKLSHQTIEGRGVWICRCGCGRKRGIRAGHIRSCIKRGTLSSCGCRDRGNPIKHGMTGTTEYRSWSAMKKRCYDRYHHKYPLYGGRGIKVYEKWITDFAAFYKYLGPKPSKRHTLDRKNPNGNYVPGNVRWATPLQQRHNRRN